VSPRSIDNGCYADLGERWYTADDDPVALLRAEARLRTGWVLETLRSLSSGRSLQVLDVGCGGGFLTSPLAAAGHSVAGLDLSPGALAVARRHDPTGAARFYAADARRLPFKDATFDAVCAMDFLEHIRERDRFLAETARVLRPGGLFLFHTFNRNPFSHLVAIKGVAWFVRNTPRDMHVIELFLKPRELRALCAAQGLRIEAFHGVRPKLLLGPMARLLFTGRVDARFEFVFTRCLAMGYCGFARKD
jgi:2-polyprenyl-6-hydroxyphenyl methylase/3-demethylubiquinone-9 3-methyltransferase